MTSNFIYNKQIEQAMDKWGVSWFKFDESSGNVMDSKGTAVGTVYADATRVTGWNGEGYAMKFNGTSTSYIQFASKVIPNGTYSLRFKMKLFTKPTAENQEIFSNAYATADHAGLRIYVDTAGQLAFTACRKNSGNTDFSIVTSAMFDSQWHDYLMSWDTTNKIVILYIDGVLAGQSSSVTQNTLVPTYNLKVGRQAVSAEGRYFNGELDDVQIYNKALTPLDFILNKTLILSNGKYKTYKEIITKSDDILTEKMASNISNDGIASSTSVLVSPTYEPYKAFNRAWESVNDAWYSSAVPTISAPQRLMFEFNYLTILEKIKIYPTVTGNITSSPKDFKFEGWDGSNWVTLLTQTSVTNWVFGTPKEYVINTDKYFKKYSLTITSNNGDATYVSVGELEMYGSIVDVNWSTVSSTLPTQEQLLSKGMDSLSPLLDRRVERLEPLPMTDKSEILPVNEEGKVFSKTINLKKYMDIRSIRMEVK